MSQWRASAGSATEKSSEDFSPFTRTSAVNLYNYAPHNIVPSIFKTPVVYSSDCLQRYYYLVLYASARLTCMTTSILSGSPFTASLRQESISKA